MGFRITTNMMMNSYQFNLQNSTKRLSDARDMVLTQRKFSSYAEDPAAATLSFRLRRSYLQTSSYLANTKDVYSKFNTAWHNLTGVIEDLSDATARVASIRGNNGPSGESRRALAIDLRETANSLVQAMNQKLGDHFIFAGNDALNPPFSWSDDGTILYYRGVNVYGGWLDNPTKREAPSWFQTDSKTGMITTLPGDVPTYEDIDGNSKLTEDEKAWEKAWVDYYWDEVRKVPNPSTYQPAWASNKEFFNTDGTLKETVDEDGNTVYAVEQWLKEHSPNGEHEVSAADKAWIEYYENADASPLQRPAPEWFKTNSKTGEITTLPEEVPDPNDPNVDDYERAWIEYYNNQKFPAPKPSTYEPEWTSNKKLFNSDGTIDADYVRGWIEQTYNRKVSSADEAWIAYYEKANGVTDPTKQSAPSWYDTGENVPWSSSDPFEQAWIEYYYYQQGRASNPTTTKPAWMDNKELYNGGNLDEDAVKEWFERQGKEMTAADKAWLEFGMNRGPDPSQKPAWYDTGNIPSKSDDPYDQMWVEYYYYKQGPVPNPDTYKPAWTENKNIFNEKGVLKEGEVEKWFEDRGKKMTSADKAWIEYYKTTGAKPTECPAPDWYYTGENVPESSNDPYEQAWVDYYNLQKSSYPDPSTYEPKWADAKGVFDDDGNFNENAVSDWFDERDKEMTAADMAWIEYYKKASTVKTPPQQDAPEWTKNAIDEETGLPVDMPESSNDSYEQAWIDYYNYKKEMKNKEPVPNPAEDKPAWTENTKLFEKDGKLNREAVEEWFKDAKKEISPLDEVWMTYYDDLYVAQEDLRMLKQMSGEEMYIDLGMGAAESSPNNPVKGTYFNSALCGIDFLGFGRDEDGDPLNLALIMKELADVFDTWDEDTQSYNPALAKNSAEGLSSDELEAKAYRLMDKLKAAQEHTTEKWIELDANSVYLQTSESRLSIQMTDINMQILDIEQVDLAEAITIFSWEQYCYNAALKIGNQLLSQSLIDYMN